MEPFQQQNLTLLFETERQQLYRYACFHVGNTEDAHDAIQDALCKLLCHEGKVKNLKGYLYRTVANACTDIIRNRQKTEEGHQLYLQLNDSETSHETSEETYRSVALQLLMIPEEQSEVIRLRFHADKSFAEIAEMLNLPLPTVKSRFLYGMEKLRKSLNPKV